MRRILLLIAIFTILGVLLPSMQVTAAKPKIVVLMKGMMGTDIQLEAAIVDFPIYDWVVVTETLTASDLEGANVLIIVLVDATMTITNEELTVIKNWLNEGHKMIWIAGDSDYGNEGPPRQDTANKVLEAIGSKLRVDLAEAVDTQSNAGKPYRVLGLAENCDEEVKFLVAGVTRALFHGPAAIIAYVDGNYVKLNEMKVENVYRVMWTSDAGMISEFNPPNSPVYTPGEEGRFVLLAIEVVPDKKNIIVVGGDAPFDHYTGMYKPELKNPPRYEEEYPTQGAMLFSNIIYWGVNVDEFIELVSYPTQIKELQDQVSGLQSQVSSLQEQVTTLEGEVAAARSTGPMYLVGGIVVGLIIGFAVAFFMKKK